jgi:phenylpropionate dioxygenase-like ring-hydroxylating dioxygenase large terminal subunit
MSGFLHNAWYVAAWSHEIGAAPFARRLLGEPVVFFRRSDGKVAALRDRCPHRFVPLSRGKVEGDRLHCGYHGLCFESDGTCSDKRVNDQLKAAAKLHAYPTEERHGAIWIWMGERNANPDGIPDFSFQTDGQGHSFFGVTYMSANYKLEIDNLLDLSHLDHLHPGGLSNGHLGDGVYKAWQDGSTVHSGWWNPDCATPFQFLPYVDGEPRVDQWVDTRWEPPGSVHLHTGVTKRGRPKEAGYQIYQGHFVTPETETTTHYFWSAAFPDHGEPAELVAAVKEAVRSTFDDEDRPMLEAQQRAMKGTDFWAELPIILPEDAGAIRARRVLEKLIRDEQDEKPPLSIVRA